MKRRVVKVGISKNLFDIIAKAFFSEEFLLLLKHGGEGSKVERQNVEIQIVKNH
jgi:hypothetical protein